MNRTLNKIYNKVKDIMGPTVYVNVSEATPAQLLQEKTVVVTGGSGGIGYQIAKKCLEQGARVAITGTHEEKLSAVKAQLKEYGDIYTLQWNIGDLASHKWAIDELISWGGEINCWVNNAGIYKNIDHTNCTETEWDNIFSVNLKGPYFATNEIIKYFLANKISGNIVNIASEVGQVATTKPYGLSKAAVISYTKGLAYELCSSHIRVNGIAPGGVATAISGISPDSNIHWDSLGGRLIRPEEIAEVAVFLLSDLSKCINGEIITCNEGNTLRVEYSRR